MTDTTRRVYVGRYFEGTKLHHFFADEDAPTVPKYYWPKAKSATFLGARIGHIYEFPEGKLTGTWESKGTIPEDTRLRLQVIDQANGSRANQMKLKPAPELEELMARLVKARTRLSGPQAAAFDAWVLSQLRQGW